ncbi:hypothetical protein H5V45_11140 [Nocardioides sp. KIGAM211]|uniref:SWIM-type domain-containing protein n=1 Tax=Nocardioides luti TaxID=2761101 RepID=A0A7X0RGN4_9ACTN|nr:hypothetical protein [Nocardioides luti]MBB6627872.1 hypothetical protein [Nocardioides luti]
MTALVHPRVAACRGAARASTWWGKAWVRAVEESAYADRDLVAGRALSRSGRIGQITTDEGGFVAAVEDDQGLWTVSGSVPLLDLPSRGALVETVAAEAGRVAALLAGELPHTLVEHAEEAGVELLPYGGELASACTCDAWVDPCAHALGVLYQLTWLIEADPFVLLGLRGLARDDLLAELHARAVPDPEPPVGDDLETGLDAALRAARVLDLLDDPERPVDHLF